jgi:glucokinase
VHVRHVIALDVGGTGMKAALVGADGGLLHEARRPTDRERGPDAVVASVLDFAAALYAHGVREFGEPAAAAGVAVPGVVDDVNGIAVYSANVGWRDVPLRALLADRLGIPVWLGHDVRAGALAEALRRGEPDFLFVTIGTGIGGAIVRGGRPDPGAHGLAGELGHVVVAPDGPQCGCGRRGCVEALASGAAVAARYRAAGGDAGATTADVAARAAGGDALAAAVWREAIDALADGLHAAVALLDPPLVILGGGVARAGDDLLEPLTRALAERVTFQALPRLALAELGDEAGCLGAAAAAWELALSGAAAGR